MLSILFYILAASALLSAAQTSRRIHPNGDVTKCVDVRGRVFADNTPVQICDCNGTPAQDWLWNDGLTKMQPAGTNFCLDAGPSPSDGVGMRISTCQDNSSGQKWLFDQPILQLFQAQPTKCLYLPDGKTTCGNQLQILTCSIGNQNQFWTTTIKSSIL